MIFSCYMVWNKVHYNFHSYPMCTFNELFPFLHSMFYVYRKIGINIIIIRDCVCRTSFTFYYLWMLTWNTVTTVISSCSVPDNTCVPYMSKAHRLNSLQRGLVKVVELSTSVFFNRTILLAGCVTIAKQTWKNLIYCYLFIHYAIP